MDTKITSQDSADFVETPGRDYVARTKLKPGTVGLTGAIMQNIALIAPAVAAFFFTQTLVASAGAQAPLAYLLGFTVVLALGVCLVQLAKKFPSAGGYFTYVSCTLGPRLGFLTGWMFMLYSPIVAGPTLAVLGQVLEGELRGNYGWAWFHWWMVVVAGLPLVAQAGYVGMSVSIRAIVIVGAAEFLIVLALGVSGLLSPGPGGFSFLPFSYGFNPGGIATFSGVALAVVLTVQGLTGWEAAVSLAEETTNPRRNVPRAIMASITIIGVMLVTVMWGQVIGWGTDDLRKLVSSPELPALVIAHRVWGPLWWLALVAMITSAWGVSLAGQNVATRMWYRMGCCGVLPAAFGRVHPMRRTPTLAVTAQLALSTVFGLALPALMGPMEFFVFAIGFVLVLAVILIYVAANIGVIKYYRISAREEFNWLLHFVFPLGTSAVLIYSLYASFVPLPASPNNWSPAVAGLWLVLGIVVLVWMRLSGNETWLSKAAEIIEEREVPRPE
ncbi:MAG TPA: APC family permease [Rhizomicrobium sp.]|nr:APC family permease [Rhizomicrobium sp.]